MKYSIIVPVYNIEDYIDQCIESLVEQTWSDFEVILVNDGSKDNSKRKIEEWSTKDKRVNVVNKINGGLSSARNEGLKHATGDYVLYVDGDDWVAHDLLSNINNHINKVGTVDIICYSYIEYYNNQIQRKRSYQIDELVYTGPDFFRKSSFHVQAWNKVYKRNFLLSIGLEFIEGRLHEDISYTVPLCFCTDQITAIKQVGYYYRKNRENSIMSMVTERNVNDFSHALCFSYKFIQKHNRLTPELIQWITNGFFNGCFTHKTRYTILKRCHHLNGTINIMNDISRLYPNIVSGNNVKYFYLKLWYRHIIQRSKYILGQIMHYKRYHP